MLRDSHFAGFSSLMGSNSISNEYPTFPNGVEFNCSDPSLDISFTQNPFIPPESDSSYSAHSSSVSLEGETSSPSDDNDFSATFKYINEVLMEDDMEEKPCMFHNPLALQATEKNLYEIIGQKYPAFPDQQPRYNVEIPSYHSSSYVSDPCSTSCPSSVTSHLIDSFWSVDDGKFKTSLLETPIPSNFVFWSTSKSSSQSSLSFQNGSTNYGNGLMASPANELLVPNLFSKSELVSQFKRGVEEANKFLPQGNQLVIDLDSRAFAPELKGRAPKEVVKVEKDEIGYLPAGLWGKKNHEREDVDLEEERSNKQSATDLDESELSEMFDKMFICDRQNKFSMCAPEASQNDGESKTRQQNGQTDGSIGEKNRAKKQVNKKEVVDLRSLLILCAQAVSADDHRTATEQLKQIKQHSSPFGDGTQRLAHCFANSLEARLAGTGCQIYTALSSKRRSALDMLKAYQVYIEACPFNKIAIIFANNKFLELAEKATTLHIIDFGILYGFQWPALISRLAKRPGGPPKLRITGIELPQCGFRPAERVQETGRRLAQYCERFNVPFEYNAIAQNWENIKVVDLKIRSDEVVAVNCLFRFKNLHDESVVVSSPRNAVLNLIKKINPNIFIQAVVNGSYSAPFFVTRFREALFHYSALFDMWDMNVDNDNQMRLMYEKEFYGREVMNVIACEGLERVERPETYKQWQVRNMRAGFKQLPLDPKVMRKLRDKTKFDYNIDFSVEEDGNWMLQGWKGRIVYASSAWVPA